MGASGQRMAETLEHLISIPSPTGNTKEVINFCRNLLGVKGIDTILTDEGSLLITLKGENQSRHRFVYAHVDTQGAIVNEIKSDGRLKFSLISEGKHGSLEGEYCTIHTRDGTKYSGTILVDKSFAHGHKESRNFEKSDVAMEVRLDAFISSAKEVESYDIHVGDFISFESRFQRTEEGFIKSRYLDNKASIAVLLEVLEIIEKTNANLPYTTHFLLSNEKGTDVGRRDSFPAPPVEYLSVDMSGVKEGQCSSERAVSICATEPRETNLYGLCSHLEKSAKNERINYQTNVHPSYTPSVLSDARLDIRHGQIGPGVDKSHSLERTHVDSLINTYLLLMAYVQSPLNE